MRKTPLILLLTFIVMGAYSPILHGNDGFSLVLNGDGNIPFPHVPGEVLVKWKENASIHSIRCLKSAMGLRATKMFPTIAVQHMRIPPSMRTEDVLAKLRGNPLVEYAEPNYVLRALATPNDPQFNQLWGLHNTGQTGGTPDADIDAPEAWDIHTGSPDVVIAVIDTGVAYGHTDLTSNMWTNDPELNGIPGVDDDGNGYVDDVSGWDFVGEDSDPTDYYAHGTHVAGTIAAIGNNATGITGVNWLASIMPLRIFGAFGYGDSAKAIEAITYAVDNGAHVINASWGGGGFSQALYDAISYANNRGCLFVAAAGNSSDDNDINPFYPASYDLPNIISVAATEHNDNLAGFSNFGATSVDVAAPGLNVLSSIPFLGLGPENQVLDEDFESGLGNWTHGGINDSWELTEAFSASPTHSLADTPSGDYLDETESTIVHNTSLNLVDKFAVLEYQLRYDLASGDYLYVGATLNGGGFLPLYAVNFDGRFSGSSGGSFESHMTSVSPFGDLSNDINVGFQLSSDGVDEDDGVYIDDVILKTRDLMITGYGYFPFAGTSMAAPHVSGLAGLILARYPGITLDALKDRILNGVDTIANLNGKVVTNGRVNAYKSLALPVGPTNLTATILSLTQINLRWSDNSDPGFNEDGFRIERRKATSGNYVEIATVGQNVTTYSDILSEWGTYYYRVRAYNTLGNSSYSNEATPFLFVEGGDGGCFIATAAFGSPLERHVRMLRGFRDRYLLTNILGKAIVGLYYEFGPPMAGIIAKNEALRAVTRVGLYPLVGSRYVALRFSHTGNIVLFMAMLAILAGMIHRVAKRSELD
ncbi:MAG: S8 family serine peptidase [Deltaproteobacteria bacterium]|nr:S8 family serine peptidase [Deltaproteobacteria bacterium]